jgi:hypothetical protein
MMATADPAAIIGGARSPGQQQVLGVPRRPAADLPAES